MRTKVKVNEIRIGARVAVKWHRNSDDTKALVAAHTKSAELATVTGTESAGRYVFVDVELADGTRSSIMIGASGKLTIDTAADELAAYELAAQRFELGDVVQMDGHAGMVGIVERITVHPDMTTYSVRSYAGTLYARAAYELTPVDDEQAAVVRDDFRILSRKLVETDSAYAAYLPVVRVLDARDRAHAARVDDPAHRIVLAGVELVLLDLDGDGVTSCSTLDGRFVIRNVPTHGYELVETNRDDSHPRPGKRLIGPVPGVYECVAHIARLLGIDPPTVTQQVLADAERA